MKHFLKIENSSFRVEVNMRTAEAWERISGKKIGQFEMEAALSAKNGGVATRTMIYWLYCALVEGESLEGREFPYNLEDLKKVIKPSILTHFAPIFLDCYMGDSVASNEKQAAKEQKKRARSLQGSVSHSFFRSHWVVSVGLLMIFMLAVLLIYLLL